MSPKRKVAAWECNRCSHVWIARKPGKPQRCAKCKDVNWDRPRVRKMRTVEDPSSPRS